MNIGIVELSLIKYKEPSIHCFIRGESIYYKVFVNSTSSNYEDLVLTTTADKTQKYYQLQNEAQNEKKPRTNKTTKSDHELTFKLWSIENKSNLELDYSYNLTIQNKTNNKTVWSHLRWRPRTYLYSCIQNHDITNYEYKIVLNEISKKEHISLSWCIRYWDVDLLFIRKIKVYVKDTQTNITVYNETDHKCLTEFPTYKSCGKACEHLFLNKLEKCKNFSMCVITDLSPALEFDYIREEKCIPYSTQCDTVTDSDVSPILIIIIILIIVTLIPITFFFFSVVRGAIKAICNRKKKTEPILPRGGYRYSVADAVDSQRLSPQLEVEPRIDNEIHYYTDVPDI